MTDRLYYADAYLTRFEGLVVGRAGDGTTLYLDRSAFYPTSGGQPHDMGTLAGSAVRNVVDEGERVAHILAEPVLVGEGDTVSGEVDWERRFDLMQQHTGQHLLSAVFADTFGWETVSVHFGPDYATLDLATDGISPTQLREAERQANAAAAADLPVSVTFEDAASAHGLRKPSGREGTLRIVGIEGMDRSACGGTHVRRTGEIGAILLRRQEKVRQGVRAEFLCGGRAVRRARADYEALTAMAQGLSCSIDELATLVPAQLEELKALQGEHKRLAGEHAALTAHVRHAQLAPDETGVRRLLERRATGRADDARALALAFAALPRAVFVSVVERPPSVLVAASDDSGTDAGRVLKEAFARVGGRGGGSPRLAQGTLPDAAALAEVLAVLGVPGQADATRREPGASRD